jgi:hypothetical protein
MTRKSQTRRDLETRRARKGRPRRRSAILAAALAAGASARAATFTVTSSADSGAGTLRQAILDANGNPGADAIAFHIEGSGVHTIVPESSLPVITDPVMIDGFTQPGSSPNVGGSSEADGSVHTIELDGVNTSADRACLTVGVGGGGSTIRGLVINRCPGDAILLIDSGGSNAVRGTYLGTDPTGAIALGVGGSGVRARATSDPSAEAGDVIGGDAPADRNVISGATGAGVSLETGAGLVTGNFIGTNAAGTGALPNGVGVFVDGGNNSIGGSGAAPRNVVSGNSGRGVTIGNLLGDPGASNNIVAGNFVGTDATGAAPLGNGASGIAVNGPHNLVGGTDPDAGNVIASNAGSGVEIVAGDGTTVQGNRIGTDASGANRLGNALAGVGIHASSVLVGGTTSGAANTIAYSGSAGVIVFAGTGNTIRGNAIYDNAELGIDLGYDGASFNDYLDADEGPNRGQNYPVLSSAMTGGTTRVRGVLHAAASTSYSLDFYANPACTRFPSDFLEGQTYLGASQVSTDGSGNGPFDVILGTPTEIGARITMTATDPAGNTSELSQRLPFSVTPDSGPADGGGSIAISGTDFETDAQVFVGGLPAADVEVADFDTIIATLPELAPGSVNDLTVLNPDGSSGTLEKAYVADFLDVPEEHQFYASVTRLVASSVATGIGNGFFGVDGATLRQQMAVFLLKAKHGACWRPPHCTGVFADVPCPSPFADWIEALAAEGTTAGCGAASYCPQDPVRRDQMAVFLLKSEHGPGYAPPTCTGEFVDVQCPSPFADWIEQLAGENVTGGCGNGSYCPLDDITRGQMAVFVAKVFYLQ